MMNSFQVVFKNVRVFLFLFFVLLQTVVTGLILLISDGYNSILHQYQKKYMYMFFTYILNCKINIKNIDNFNINKHYIIMANHYTALDYFILNIIFPSSLTIVKDDLLTQRKKTNISVKIISLFSRLFFKTGMIFGYVRNNKNSGEQCKKNILKNLKNHNIIIFPEGTSSKKGIPKNFKKGLFYLCKDNNIPILPCTIKYSKDIGLDPPPPMATLRLTDWIGVNATINVLPEILPEKFEDVDTLLNFSFKTIISNLK
jgi:1-acyl-sn-glycerol-3-phosphate acyltransferase